MVKGVTHGHLGPTWYHLEPSDVSYFPKSFLVGTFFAVSYSKPALEVGENLNKLLESNKIKTKTKLRQRNEKREKNFHLIATQWVLIYFEGVFDCYVLFL